MTSYKAPKAVVRRDTDEVQGIPRPESAQAHQGRPLPPIVRIVLTQAMRLLMRGQITTVEFNAQVERLAREELEPRGLSMLVRDLPGRTTRFLIKTTTTGQVWDIIKIGPDGEPHGGDFKTLLQRTLERRMARRHHARLRADIRGEIRVVVWGGLWRVRRHVQ